MKYSKEFKIECVRKCKAHEHINDPPGIEHSSFRHMVINWTKIYDSLGEAGFDHNRPTLDINQRLELFSRVENGESYKSVALSAGIGNDLLIKWHKIYLEKGIDGLKSLKRGRAMTNTKPKKDNSESELEQLKEELEYYKAENEYLKKLNALVQKRKAQEQKKK